MGKAGLGWGRKGVQSLVPGILSLIELIKPAVMKLWKQFNIHVWRSEKGFKPEI